MRVGVLTFHRALNYGAVLQAYALQRCLQSFGVDCEIIDYHCETLERTYRALRVANISARGVASAIVHLQSRVTKNKHFENFRSRCLNLSAQEYTRDDIASANASYDLFVVGSDQVWNPTITGNDQTYFLDFCDVPSMKISYAASLGKARSFDAYSALYRKNLSSFQALSVREEDGRDYLVELLHRDIEWVMDPVFLLSADDWGVLSKGPTTDKPYIFVFCLHETALYAYVERLRAVTGFDVVYVPESIKTRIPGRRVSSPSVEEWIGYIQHAEFVVSDSFHAIALAIAFQRDFKAQLKYGLPELNSRITSLLSSVRLEGQILQAHDRETDSLPEVDYDGVTPLVAQRVQKSRKYLREALGLNVGD